MYIRGAELKEMTITNKLKYFLYNYFQNKHEHFRYNFCFGCCKNYTPQT